MKPPRKGRHQFYAVGDVGDGIMTEGPENMRRLCIYSYEDGARERLHQIPEFARHGFKVKRVSIIVEGD